MLCTVKMTSRDVDNLYSDKIRLGFSFLCSLAGSRGLLSNDSFTVYSEAIPPLPFET